MGHPLSTAVDFTLRMAVSLASSLTSFARRPVCGSCQHTSGSTKLRWVVIAWLAVMPRGQEVARGDERQAIQTGSVTGQLLTAEGEPDRRGSVFVFVVDGQTGYPLHAESHQPIGRATGFAGIEGWWHATTNRNGRFQLTGMPPATYRLVAQSWPGRTTVPDRKAKDGPVMLHGTTQVKVSPGEQQNTNIQSLGTAALEITNEPQEGNAYVFIGRRATTGDPILGPSFWGDNYLQSIVCGLHLRGGQQTVFGLPNQGPVYVRYLNYDNNPGLGGVDPNMSAMTRITLPVYATWSNGYHRPPPRLANLVEWVRDHQQETFELLTDGRPDDFRGRNQIRNHQKLSEFLQQQPDRTVHIDGSGKVRILDLAAAERYLAILQHHEQR